MKKDKLDIIYEYLIDNKDYLLCSDSSDDFDALFEGYKIYNPLGYLFNEEFKIIEQGKDIKFGKQDIYEINVNNFRFISYISYYPSSVFDEKLQGDIISGQVKGMPIIKLQPIKKVLEENKDREVCVISFVDSDNNMKLTGKVKNYTYSVIKSVEGSVKDSLIKRGGIKKVVLFSLLINKNEPKRLSLYSKLFDKLVEGYKNQVVDDKSDENNLILYRF